MSKPVKKPATWLNLLIDYGPVLVFFVSYRLLRPTGDAPLGEVMAVTKSTGAFVIATIIALVASKWLLGRIAPMLWLTTALVTGFGLLTVITQDQAWIMHKPTAVYLMFAVMLIGGWLRGKAVLKYLLESAFEGLSEAGWLKLSINWGVFFLVLAGLNEALANYGFMMWLFDDPARGHVFDRWLNAKLFVFLPLSFLFTFVQLPMLLKHGLGADAEPEVIAHPPHE